MQDEMGHTAPRRRHASPPSTALSLEKSSLPCAKFAGVLLASLVIAALVAVLALAVAGIRTSMVTDRAVCDTQDCVVHARRLLARLNTAADPCKVWVTSLRLTSAIRDADFHTYVCGGDHRGASATAEGPQPVRAARRQGLELLLALGNPASVLSSNYTSTAAFKALKALDACEAKRTNQSAGPLVNFMRERGLPWPASLVRPPTLLKVLDILLDLAINWRVALWFDVRLAVYGPDGKPVVAFGEPSHLPLYRMEQLSELNAESYAEAVWLVASFIAGGTEKLCEECTVKFAKTAVHQLRSDETSVRVAVLSGEVPDEHDALLPASFIFQNSRGALGNISSDEWAALLSKHIGAGGPSFQTPDTMVLVVHKQRLVKLAGVLSALPPARLLDVVGWTLAYTYAWTINSNLDVFAVGTKSDAMAAHDLTAHILCFLTVHESYGIAQDLECRLTTARDPHERRAVADLFALDVALAAMQRAALTDTSPLRLKSLQGMNGVQTFYVSYCSHFCDDEQATPRSMCNLAMNGSGFGSAFGCDLPPAGGATPQCLFV
ncbi:hypothetical protein V5799_012359 [Amblyomma americanum]|uniref:Uncharacterized protein n=1 Tax=Amblyomma americanum TaxID=6943 RepID=A0AAQ4EEP8_AMBAM